MIYLAVLRLQVLQFAIQAAGTQGPDATMDTAERMWDFIMADHDLMLGEIDGDIDTIGETEGSC